MDEPFSQTLKLLNRVSILKDVTYARPHLPLERSGRAIHSTDICTHQALFRCRPSRQIQTWLECSTRRAARLTPSRYLAKMGSSSFFFSQTLAQSTVSRPKIKPFEQGGHPESHSAMLQNSGNYSIPTRAILAASAERAIPSAARVAAPSCPAERKGQVRIR